METIALILVLAVMLLAKAVDKLRAEVDDLKKESEDALTEVVQLERRFNRGPEISYRSLLILNRRLKGLQKKGIK